MRAAVYTGYGPPDVVQVKDVEKPVPKDNEVLIKVRAAAVNPLDYHLMRGRLRVLRLFLGLRKPKMRPGRDVAAQVEAVGSKVTRFKAGDPVFGTCVGAFAEYACAPESKLVMKPEGVTYEQAASAPIAALTALQGLRDAGKVQPGQKILINGAAGGVGTYVVQIGKWLGAEVTGVCSTRNVDMLRSLGAERVVDYTREDFTQGAYRYDVIFDLVGNHSFLECTRVMNPRGIYVGAGVLAQQSVLGFLVGLLTAPVLSLFVVQKFTMAMARSSEEDLRIVGELIAAGKIIPVIDRRYPLTEVAAALRYLEEKHARGKVIIALEA